jgi:branched-chain amino acid transport system substrate-binding protein
MAGCEDAPAPASDGSGAGKTFKIGVIAPLSGPAAAYGEEKKKIMDYHLEQMNAKNKYKIELVWEDGKCDAAAASAAFQKLTDVDGVKFIIGGLCSSETLAIAPLAKDAGALVMSAMSSNPEIEGKSPNVMTLSYSDALVGEGLAKELANYKKIALITEQNDFNTGIKKVVENTLASQYKNVEIVSNEQFEKGATEFRNLLEKVKASGAEAVLLNPNVGVTSEALIKQVAEVGLTAKLIGQVAYTSPEILAKSPDLVEGMVLVDAPAVIDTKFVEYRDKIVAAKGGLDNVGAYYTASAIDALDLMARLIAENNEDVNSVQKALSTGSFTGYIGKITFDGKSFVQGVTVARYVIKDKVAVLEK